MDRDAESDSEGVGQVTYRSRLTPTASRSQERSTVPSSRSTRSDYEYYAPIHSSDTRSPGIRRSGSHHSVPDLLPPDLEGKSKEEPPSNSFKGWLTSGILDVLGAAAGVTLSTTGKLVAPPLHVTKTLILPGLLALFVDTLDAITPPWVQDWFRILSSSLHHLMVVLGNTEKGKLFSNQVYVVLQDVLHVFSAPESRQVLVDGMATSVKLAGALNTQETKEFLEQLSTLGIRLLDAASSGKAKQLVKDTNEVAWKGIEMAADPATTLALAEVTAHLCYALEDTQRVLNPTPRKHRDEQNRSIYLNPFQMENFPEQVTMEEVILSCLGHVEDAVRERTADDAASVQSRLTLDDELSLPEPEYRDWKDRKEQVNVKLLREQILQGNVTTATTRNAGSSSTSNILQQVDSLAKPRGTGIHLMEHKTHQKDGGEGTLDTQGQSPYDDMEDIYLPGIPGGRRLELSAQEMALGDVDESTGSQTHHFYKKLDELLRDHRAMAAKTDRPKYPLNARIKKLKDFHAKTPRSVDTKRFDVPRLMQKYKTFIMVAFLVGSMLSAFISGLACYGLYTLVWGRAIAHRAVPQEASANQEIVVRIVREVVHVNEHGIVLGKSEAQALTQEELDAIGQKVAAFVR